MVKLLYNVYSEGYFTLYLSCSDCHAVLKAYNLKI